MGTGAGAPAVEGAEPAVRVLYVTFLAATAALGGFLFGFDSAVINGAVSGIQKSFAVGSGGVGVAVAAILPGCAVGALVAGRLADRRGRRAVMFGAAGVFAVTAVWAALAGSVATFVVARFLSGLGVGAASVVCPAYIAEISPARMRGRLAALQQLGIVVGIFIALLSDELLARAAGGVSAALWLGPLAWRWMFLVEVVPAVLFWLAVLGVPESPRFLMAVGRRAAALTVLRRIAPATPDAAVDEIERTVLSDHTPRLSDLRARVGWLVPIAWVGIGLSMLQQLVGINSIFYYGAALWEQVGFTAVDALDINVVTGLVNIVSTLLAIVLVDRIGRRPLLLWGSVGMTVTLGALVAAFSTGAVSVAGTAAAGNAGHVALSPHAGLVALVAANLYVFAFGLSWGPCVWILLGEMFPNRIRSAALALAVFAQWMANGLVAVSFPPLATHLGPAGAYAIYMTFAILSFLFVHRTVRETRGIELEAM
jgi:SP family sugar:H+ symporter-like MFS transporter